MPRQTAQSAIRRRRLHADNARAGCTPTRANDVAGSRQGPFWNTAAPRLQVPASLGQGCRTAIGRRSGPFFWSGDAYRLEARVRALEDTRAGCGKFPQRPSSAEPDLRSTRNDGLPASRVLVQTERPAAAVTVCFLPFGTVRSLPTFPRSVRRSRPQEALLVSTKRAVASCARLRR